MHTGIDHKEGDGSDWTVCEDWESGTGIVNDLLTIDSTIEPLCEHFQNKLVFLEVIDALHRLTGHITDSKCQRAQHQALGYMINKGKLWHVPGPKSTCA